HNLAPLHHRAFFHSVVVPSLHRDGTKQSVAPSNGIDSAFIFGNDEVELVASFAQGIYLLRFDSLRRRDTVQGYLTQASRSENEQQNHHNY
ncbi:MAG: hypothetical protein KDB01_20515, partial [Planctomycetaceae bacterium]|nr:hypothetical protein [Planctomycetaceae bacterium]